MKHECAYKNDPDSEVLCDDCIVKEHYVTEPSRGMTIREWLCTAHVEELESTAHRVILK